MRRTRFDTSYSERTVAPFEEAYLLPEDPFELENRVVTDPDSVADRLPSLRESLERLAGPEARLPEG